MRHDFLALAGFALIAAAASPAAVGAQPVPAGAEQAKPVPVPTEVRPGQHAAARKKARAVRKAAAPAGPSGVAEGLAPSPDVQRVAGWILASGDNQGLPYIIIDKPGAQLLLYSAAGELLAEQPVLLGIAPGDQSTPGVGSKNLAEIGTAEKTTPAGRFLARFGHAAGRQKVLWVDYTNSVALHPIPATASPKEQRRQRLLSPDPGDNRITFGCINVPTATYTRSIVPLFRKQGGYVYVLPDALALDDVFPLLRTRPVIQAQAVGTVAPVVVVKKGPHPAR